mgnify:CR=1 FL=1
MARKKLMDALADASAAASAAARKAGKEKLRTGEGKPEGTGTASKSRVDLATMGGKTTGMAKRLKEKMRQYKAIEDKSSEKATLLMNAITEMKSKLPDSVVKKVTDSLTMNKGGAVKKPAMMRGGMANGKAHMYAAGGAVMDNLTAAQRNMVKKMAAANKK